MKTTNKDKRITIRLTPEQYESICSRAKTAMMSPSAYIRAAAMRHKVCVVPGLKEMVHEMKGIGRNLNQLTMLANAGTIREVSLKEMDRRLDHVYIRLSEIASMEGR